VAQPVWLPAKHRSQFEANPAESALWLLIPTFSRYWHGFCIAYGQVDECDAQADQFFTRG